MREKCDSDVVSAMMSLRGKHASDPGILPSKSYRQGMHVRLPTSFALKLRDERKTKPLLLKPSKMILVPQFLAPMVTTLPIEFTPLDENLRDGRMDRGPMIGID